MFVGVCQLVGSKDIIHIQSGGHNQCYQLICLMYKIIVQILG